MLLLETHDGKERTCFPEQWLDGDSCTERVAGEALVETFMPPRRTFNIDCASSVNLANLQWTKWLQYQTVFVPNVPVVENVHNDCSVDNSTRMRINRIHI